MTELFATSKQTISYYIANILKDGKLDPNSVVKDYLTTAIDGKQYHVVFYALEMILAVGYRVKGIIPKSKSTVFKNEKCNYEIANLLFAIP